MTNYLQLLEKAGFTPNNVGKYRAAEIFGTGRTKALRILKELRAGNPGPKNAVVGLSKKPDETQQQTANSWDIGLEKTRIHTLDQLIAHFKIDTSVWECKSFTANKWEFGAKSESGDIIVEPLYQIKASFVKAKGMTVEAVKAEIESLKAEAKRSIGARPKPLYGGGKKSGNCLEVSLYDAHFGRLSWGDETLWENYDLGIAELEYDRAVDIILSRNSQELQEICYVVGNDLLHVDNPNNTTTRGTPQDVDGRYHKVFSRTRAVIQRQIEKFRQIAPVKVIFVPGNHDTLSTWHLGDSIECYYHQDRYVDVVNSPAPRKYYQWGKVGLMLCHGDKGKHANYPLLFATERPELWADCDFREVHTGHFHHEVVKDHMGCRVRRLPAMCPADEYHSSNGYVGNIRGGAGFLWNKEDGLIGTIEYALKGERS